MKKNKIYLGLCGLTLISQVCFSKLQADVGAKSCFSACSGQNTSGAFLAGGDWLYWKVEEERLQVGTVVSESLTVPTDVRSTILRPNFREKSGYRLYAGYLTSDDSWKVELAFSHISPNANLAYNSSLATIDTNFVSLIVPNFSLFTPFIASQFNNIGANWNLKLNYADFDLSKEINFTNRLQINPHVGVRAEWIDQTYSVEGSGINFTETPHSISFISQMRSKMSGVGLEAGLSGTWLLGGGFAIVGHFGGSIVYVKTKTNGVMTTNEGAVSVTNFADHSHVGLPSSDAFLGFTFTKKFGKKKLHLHFAWEYHVLHDLNQFSLTGGGDLTMQGLSMGGVISF